MGPGLSGALAVGAQKCFLISHLNLLFYSPNVHSETQQHVDGCKQNLLQVGAKFLIGASEIYYGCVFRYVYPS